MTVPFTLTVNGAEQTLSAPPELSLLNLLREQLDLTGSKICCAEGACGACTVLVNGQAVRACTTPAQQAIGARVTTIEGLAQGEQLHPLQQAFLDTQAFQCGYCTPGMIMAAAALLAQHANPDEATIRSVLQGNLCRCGVYTRIVQAVQQAARVLQPQSMEGTAQ